MAIISQSSKWLFKDTVPLDSNYAVAVNLRLYWLLGFERCRTRNPAERIISQTSMFELLLAPIQGADPCGLWQMFSSQCPCKSLCAI